MRRRAETSFLLLSLLAGTVVPVAAQEAAPAANPPAAETPAPAQATPPATGEAAPAPAVDFRSKVYEYKSLTGGLHRPTGEVTVTADRAEWLQAGVMRYTGNVTLSVDTLELRGDGLELKQFDGGLYEAHLTGEPAKLSDAGAEGAPPITAHAKRLDYDARTSIAELAGGAVLTRGSDRLTGENIKYDTAARRVQAAGGSSGQVRIVIQPAPNPKSEHP
jgi:lipopolysaccharide export system protein LptA